MKKFTLYPGEYLEINGHNYVGVHEIMENRVMLHAGCPCYEPGVLEVFTTPVTNLDRETNLSMTMDVGYDAEGAPFCTFEIDTEDALYPMEFTRMGEERLQ